MRVLLEGRLLDDVGGSAQQEIDPGRRPRE
jgi:hypothetical protein